MGKSLMIFGILGILIALYLLLGVVIAISAAFYIDDTKRLLYIVICWLPLLIGGIRDERKG